MKKIGLLIVAIVFIPLLSWCGIHGEKLLSSGSQPQISIDNSGVIRIVFGLEDKIFCATSLDNGITFSNPTLVAQVPQMRLGMSRGPQLASSANYSIITAMDKSGNIFCFKMNNRTNKWKSIGIINDLKGSAPEGLMNIAADKKDNFYAVWLDSRTEKHNQVYISSLTGNTDQWSKNRLVYKSPDGHVCECCQPHIAVQGSEVAIMFRNWLKGSRDLYVLKSLNGGKAFLPAEKLGSGTWKLNGCPMDGGGIEIDQPALIRTTWQRKGSVYYCQPGEPETYIGQGKSSSISGTGFNTVLTYQNKDTLKLVTLKNRKAVIVGSGGFLKSAVLPDHKILCVWEQNNKVLYKRI